MDRAIISQTQSDKLPAFKNLYPMYNTKAKGQFSQFKGISAEPNIVIVEPKEEIKESPKKNEHNTPIKIPPQISLKRTKTVNFDDIPLKNPLAYHIMTKDEQKRIGFSEELNCLFQERYKQTAAKHGHESLIKEKDFFVIPKSEVFSDTINSIHK